MILSKEIRVGGMGESQEKKVEFEAAQDVVVNGYTIVNKGDTVEGHYTSTKNVTESLLGGKVSEEPSLDVDDVVNSAVTRSIYGSSARFAATPG